MVAGSGSDYLAAEAKAQDLKAHFSADGRRFAYDNLGWTKHGIAWKAFRPARRSESTKEKRNEAAVRELAEDLMESQDKATLANTPLIEGGDVCEEARRGPFRTILRKLIKAAMREKFKEVVTVFLDESHQLAHLAVRMLRELRKFNLEIACITQSLPPEWKTDALECFRRLEMHRCNSPESARMFAGMLAALMGSDVQASDVQREIMNLKPGWRFVREWKAWKDYVPLPSDPYPWLGLTEARTETGN